MVIFLHYDIMVVYNTIIKYYIDYMNKIYFCKILNHDLGLYQCYQDKNQMLNFVVIILRRKYKIITSCVM